jgi:hypothetical protein
MKQRSFLALLIASLVSLSLLFPVDIVAQGARGAGHISRLIPTVNVQRGVGVKLGAAQMPILWGDTLTTDRGGRARVTLDDGSILNVGSESSIRVVSHDAAAQRTQIQLAYGRLRSSAVRLSRAGSSFEVRTPTAVAGVVGTDFMIFFINGTTHLHVMEGIVNLCNLVGKCVVVGAGFSSSVRTNEEPSPPHHTPPSESVQAHNATSVGGAGAAAGAAGGAVHAGILAGHSLLLAVGMVVVAVIPAAIVPAVNGAKRCGCTSVTAGKP